MESGTKCALFAGLGFLVGTVGLKVLTSEEAKDGYVKAMVQGMKCQAEYEKIVERAKAEYDDIVAEARYIVAAEAAASAEPDAALE